MTVKRALWGMYISAWIALWGGGSLIGDSSSLVLPVLISTLLTFGSLLGSLLYRGSGTPEARSVHLVGVLSMVGLIYFMFLWLGMALAGELTGG
jgi:hypothetical protein